jgi:hypothetical protein
VPSRFVIGGDPLDSDFAMAYAVYACSQGLCDGLKTKSVEVKAAKEAYRDNNVWGKGESTWDQRSHSLMNFYDLHDLQ